MGIDFCRSIERKEDLKFVPNSDKWLENEGERGKKRGKLTRICYISYRLVRTDEKSLYMVLFIFGKLTFANKTGTVTKQEL